MASPLVIYNYFKIENVIDVSSSILFPQYLQFFGIEVTHIQVPELSTALPGDWKNKDLTEDSYRNQTNILNHINKNIEQLNLITNSYKYFGEDLPQPRSIYYLFKEIKYHFINQHPLGIFETFPKNDKIIYIGGICVEEDNILTNIEKEMTENEPSCIVLVSFGTVNLSGGLKIEDVEIMFNTFSKNNHCKFKVRIDSNLLPENYNYENIEVYNTNKQLPQQEILSKENTKLFITHCGQNSLNEAIYAGVPLICIPNSVDQFYNSSLVEHLNIGIYVSLITTDYDGEKIRNLTFKKDFQKAFDKIIKSNNKYQNASNKLRNKILVNYHSGNEAKNTFLEMFERIIIDN